MSQKAISELEHEIAVKESVRDQYFKTDRIGLARKYDRSFKVLKQKLEQTRLTLSQMPDLLVIWNTLATLVAFRILVMCSNLFYFRELCKRYKFRQQLI